MTNGKKRRSKRTSSTEVLPKRNRGKPIYTAVIVNNVNVENGAKKVVTESVQVPIVPLVKKKPSSKVSPKKKLKKLNIGKTRKYKKTVLEFGTMLNGISEEEAAFIQNASVYTDKYACTQAGAVKRFFDFTKSYKKGVPFSKLNYEKLFDHPRSKAKLKVFNSIMCPFMMLFKKIERTKKNINEHNRLSELSKKGNCPYYQPSL